MSSRPSARGQDLKQENASLRAELRRYEKDCIDKQESIDALRKELDELKKSKSASVEREPSFSAPSQHDFVNYTNADLRADITEIKQGVHSLLSRTSGDESPGVSRASVDESSSSWVPAIFRGKPGCSKCVKAEERIKELQATVASYSAKLNEHAKRSTGSAIEEGQVEQMYEKFFLDKVEELLPSSGSTANKNKVRASLCTMFMNVSGEVQKAILDRMTWALQQIFLPTGKDFPGRKDVERAFSILLDVPKVKEPIEIPPKMEEEFRKEYSGLVPEKAVTGPGAHAPAALTGFIQEAVYFNEKLYKHVPPYLVSVDEPVYKKEMHELKMHHPKHNPLKPGENVSYTRPIVFFNFRSCAKPLKKGTVTPQM